MIRRLKCNVRKVEYMYIQFGNEIEMRKKCNSEFGDTISPVYNKIQIMFIPGNTSIHSLPVNSNMIRNSINAKKIYVAVQKQCRFS